MHISGWNDHLSFHGGHGMEEMAVRYPQWLKVKGATLHFQAQPEIPEQVVREVVALRLGMQELASKDFVRDELRDLMRELLEELRAEEPKPTKKSK